MLDFASTRLRLLGISPHETKFARRGFPERGLSVQRHLETAGGAFVAGYNKALITPRVQELAPALNSIDPMYYGFAYEGAAMALALLDLITPWNRSRLRHLIESPAGDAHVYMLYIGAGWAIARIPWARRKFERTTMRYDPLYRWLALDGYGFHEGFFHTHQCVSEQRLPRRLSPQAARVFDQGLGRSLWFSQGADVRQIVTVIDSFAKPRQEDLWSGVGLAASYAGGVSRDDLMFLRDKSNVYGIQLAQGAAFAGKARQRAGNPTANTELACEIFCEMPADAAAAVTDKYLQTLDHNGLEPAYQQWRAKISASFSLAKQAPHPTMAEMPIA
jgi:hypothetical protein